MSQPRVAVIIVSYNHAKFLRDLFRTLDSVTYPRDRWKIWLLDNLSQDDTVALAKRELLAADGTRTTGGVSARLIQSRTNSGFAGGNNVCMREAMAEGYDFVYLLNPDTEVEPDFLERAVEAAADPSVGAVQSLLILGEERGKLNSVGNAFHYLGFSYCVGYKDPVRSAPSGTPEIACASGAGVMFRTKVLERIGLLDETLFAYHEDVEISLRLWLSGSRVVLAPRSHVYHKYEFSRSIRKFYWMERNRWIVLFMTLRLRTLLLTAPMHALMEMGMLVFALKGGWWREKLRAGVWFLHPMHLVRLAAARRRVQALRVVRDRDLARRFTTRIAYQEVDNLLLRTVGNPLMAWYWRIVLPLIRW